MPVTYHVIVVCDAPNCPATVMQDYHRAPGPDAIANMARDAGWWAHVESFAQSDHTWACSTHKADAVAAQQTLHAHRVRVIAAQNAAAETVEDAPNVPKWLRALA